MLSAAELFQLPPDQGGEIAFIGRSNSGKSSALNAITNLKGLARTSKTPGRTQTINLFALDDDLRLVDLPGYGYAKVPLAISGKWRKTLNGYLANRNCLRGLVVVMDIRHPLKESDQNLIRWTVDCDLPLHVLLTKSDKLNYGPAKQCFLEVQEALKTFGGDISAQHFSSVDRTGLE